MIASDVDEIGIEHLPPHFVQPLMAQTANKVSELSKNLKATLNTTLIDTYQAHNGNISKVSRVLGISRNTVYRKLRALGLINAN
ncbi:helix-turn-helix domain-containing protein [Vibrio sp. M260118]|uniref:helix-turn-helix domain-containing protein n=1 Tax=Vibrio sp. M260118 TaxID=3020896 RepID=UPI002F3F790A